MRRLLILLVITLLMMTVGVSAAAPNSFANVTEADWSYTAVKELVQAGVIVGNQERFANNKPIIRYEMAILVANGMNNAAQATNEQKATIEKLSAEFRVELEKIGAKHGQPQTPKSSPLNFMIETRMQYDNTSLKSGEGGAWPAGNIKDQNQFYFRNRFYLSGAINDKWTYVSRYFQSASNINKSDGTGRWDRWYVQGKDVLGGTVMLGKQFVAPGKGGFISFYQDVNGALYKTKVGKISVKLGDYRYVMDGTSPLGANGQNMTYGELAYKPTKTSDVSVFNFRHNWNDATHDMDVRGITGAFTLPNGWTVSGEWVKNEARDAGYNGKSGYYIALQSKYGPSWRMPHAYGYEDGPATVNASIVGDSLWAISYRHAPAGVAGKFNRGMNTAVPMSTDTLGMYQNTIYDVNALRVDYYRVISKNITWVAVVDHVKPIHGNWTNNAFQTALAYTFK